MWSKVPELKFIKSTIFSLFRILSLKRLRFNVVTALYLTILRFIQCWNYTERNTTKQISDDFSGEGIPVIEYSSFHVNIRPGIQKVPVRR